MSLQLAEENAAPLPPSAPLVERQFLAGLLHRPALLGDVREETQLAGGDFYRVGHRVIFEAMAALDERGEGVDVVTIATELKNTGRLEDAGGYTGVVDVAACFPTSLHVEQHAKQIRRLSIKRQLIAAGQEIAALGYEDTEDPDEVLDAAEAKLYAIADASIAKADGLRPLKALAKSYFAELEARHDNPDRLPGLPTGFAEIDKLTAGLHEGNLIIVGGRPSMGKTAFALQIGLHVAIREKRGVAVFSLEMSAPELMGRAIAAEAKVDSNRLRTGKVQQGDWDRMAHAQGKFGDAPLLIDDTARLSVMDIRARCRRARGRLSVPLGLVVVDYLQLMRGTQRREGNREQEIAEITRGLKGLAKELGVPVLALSQLNRGLEQRSDKRPIMSDLRESGAIEQDADLICFLYRDEVYNKPTGEASNDGTAEVIIAKQRNGPTGTVELAFLKSFTRFENLARSLWTPQPGQGEPSRIGGDR